MRLSCCGGRGTAGAPLQTRILPIGGPTVCGAFSSVATHLLIFSVSACYRVSSEGQRVRWQAREETGKFSSLSGVFDRGDLNGSLCQFVHAKCECYLVHTSFFHVLHSRPPSTTTVCAWHLVANALDCHMKHRQHRRRLGVYANPEVERNLMRAWGMTTMVCMFLTIMTFEYNLYTIHKGQL